MKTILCAIFATLFAIPVAFGQEPAPKKTDSTFITEPNDLNVPKSAGQTINLQIKIDRVVGRTDGEGILQDDVAELSQNGVIERKVTLTISAYDVDRDFAEFPQCTPREFDRVKVNGHNIGDNGAEVFLDGTDKQWRKVSYKVPAEFIKFGIWTCDGNGENCSWQGEGINTIEIAVSTAAPNTYTCGSTMVTWDTKVGWGAISFKALYPVFMIHGYSSDGNFWSNNDHNFVQEFKNKKILYNNSISFPNRGKNDAFSDAYDMKPKIQDLTEQQYHVKHIHLVAHSKGGLACREYLTLVLQNFVVASLTTLSTPHKGSSQADLSLDLREVGVAGAFRSGDSIPQDLVLALSVFFARQDNATIQMRVKYMRDTFNPANEPRLPGKMKAYENEVTVKYYSYGANANTDLSVDSTTGEQTISDQEAAGSVFKNKLIVGPIFGRRAAEEAYRHLYKYNLTKVEYQTKNGKEVPFRVFRDPSDQGATLKGRNDFFVPVLSTRFVTPSQINSQHKGDEDRNHQTIAVPATAIKVIDLIKASNP